MSKDPDKNYNDIDKKIGRLIYPVPTALYPTYLISKTKRVYNLLHLDHLELVKSLGKIKSIATDISVLLLDI